MKVGIIGATGRMGLELTKLIPPSEYVGGISSNTTSDQIKSIVRTSDILVDFSTPSAILKVAEIASEISRPIVSGTTGLSDTEYKQLLQYSRHIPLLIAENFSIGIQLTANFVKTCAKLLPESDFSIIERHHHHKKDKPSGTALFLERAAGKSAQIVSLRVGEIFGEHMCAFSGENEEIIITHKAFNRTVFARGALQCAKWLLNQPPGLYNMQDFLASKEEEYVSNK